MQTEINLEIIGFSWGNILVNSQGFEQNPFNPKIFSLEGLASIATNKNEITSIHPLKRETLNQVAEELSIAVTKYYKQNVSVTITEELIIRVHFSDKKRNFLSDIISKYMPATAAKKANEENRGLGKGYLIDASKDENFVPESINRAMTDFCQKYVHTMKEMCENSELQKWCKNYSAYREITTHKDLQKLVYKKFMREAYALPFFSEYLAKADYGQSFEKRIKGNKNELITGLFLEIRMDYASNGSLINCSIADGHIYQLMEAYLQYGEKADPLKENNYRVYNLEYIQSFAGKKQKYGIGERYAYHDISLKKWRLMIQLDDKRYYFLSVFIGEDGIFDKFSLDVESASDSHYEFKSEKGLRKKLYMAGDENKYLDEILIRYVSQYGTLNLYELILPYVTAQFHYD